jgi:glycosyltransferase involved in cell wall biosynthesis
MPFFSICIPQHNRTSFLIEACRHLKLQTCQDFEVCISDDCSTDGRAEELQQFLRESQIPFVYCRQEKNRRYDGNLRAAIGLASGEYCVLMGNDDCLAEDATLESLRAMLTKHPQTGVAITNFKAFSSGQITRRIVRTGNLGSGPQVAVRSFRNVSFVSGVIFRRDRAQANATDRWDGSEMYQMYMASRIIAEGYELLELDVVAVRKDMTIPGESVDSYENRPRLNPCPIVERKTTLLQLGALVSDAVRPYAGKQSVWYDVQILLQVLFFTYPFCILNARRVQSWKFAAGNCLGMRPKNLFSQMDFPLVHRWFLGSIFFAVSCAALLMPITFFDACQPKLFAISKSILRRTRTA